jgi:hypothetical protein
MVFAAWPSTAMSSRLSRRPPNNQFEGTPASALRVLAVPSSLRSSAAAQRERLAGSESSTMVVSTDKYWFVQIDEEAVRRRDQPSFHWFAEGQHSDVRGQVFNLAAGGELQLPHDRWPLHLFIVVGIHGSVEAQVDDRVFAVRAHSQLVVLPGTPCMLRAGSAASVELISLLSTPPPSDRPGT